MTTAPTTKPFSGNAYTKALLWGGWHWADSAALPGAPVEIKYFVKDGTRVWSPAETAALAQAFQTWSDVANITFTQTLVPSEAQLVENLTTSSVIGAGILGEHGTPDSATSTKGDFDGKLLLGKNGQGYGYFNDQLWSDAGLAAGGYDFVTLVHELGHGLGLAHPHDTGGGSTLFPGVPNNVPSSFGTFQFNQGLYTVMSYNDGWASVQKPYAKGLETYGYEAGPMAFDIAAIQYLYGANTTSQSGDSVYVLPDANTAGTSWTCIWDTGGTDAITYGGARNTIIDLRAATLDLSAMGGGLPSYAPGIYGGYTIANGVVIENAASGAGNDALVGNSADNQLSAGSGNDVIAGLAGADTIDGGTGNDTASYAASLAAVVLDLAAGTASGGDAAGDVLVFDGGVSTIENLVGGAGNDALTGDLEVNALTGGAGDDTLDGAGGNDTLVGGAGNDTYLGVTMADVLKELAGQGTDAIHTGQTWRLAAGFEWLVLEGTDHINGTGNTAANLIAGNGGDNTLDGGTGADTVSYALAAAAVTVSLALQGTVQNTGGAGSDKLIGFENILGSAHGDTLTGNAAANVIHGLDGDDTMDGGLGLDTASYASNTAGVTVNLAVVGAQDTGSAGIDTLAGFERLAGGTGGDALTGNALANLIAGGAGDDTIEGGLGTDILRGETNGATGDTVSYAQAGAGVRVSLATALYQNTLGAGSDALSGFENLLGSGFDDRLTGSSTANTLSGGGGNDALAGGAGNDTLFGGGGNDVLAGGGGNDALYGEAGADTFLFNAALSTSNVDTIFDFEIGIDHMQFENAYFTRLGGMGALNPLFFAGGSTALDGNDYVLYDITSGTLYYDSNGSGANGRLTIAVLANMPNLTSADIFVV